MSCSSQPQVYQDPKNFRKACGTTARCPCKQTGFRYSNRCCTGNEVSLPQDLTAHTVAEQNAVILAALATITAADFDATGMEVDLNIMDLPQIESVLIEEAGLTVTLALAQDSSSERLYMSVATNSASAAADIPNSGTILTVTPAADTFNEAEGAVAIATFGIFA